MKTPRQVARFEKAVRDHEMMGSMHPEDQYDVQREYEKSKSALIRYIEVLFKEKLNG